MHPPADILSQGCQSDDIAGLISRQVLVKFLCGRIYKTLFLIMGQAYILRGPLIGLDLVAFCTGQNQIVVIRFTIRCQGLRDKMIDLKPLMHVSAVLPAVAANAAEILLQESLCVFIPFQPRNSRPSTDDFISVYSHRTGPSILSPRIPSKSRPPPSKAAPSPCRTATQAFFGEAFLPSHRRTGPDRDSGTRPPPSH